MGTIRENEAGFSPVEAILVSVIVVLIGVAGWFVYKNHNKKPAINSVAATTTTKPTTTQTTSATQTAPDPYAGWKTYTSPLKSGLSFKYPADWDFTPSTTTPSPNNLGGVENDSVLRSAKVQGTYGTVTNQYMCVSIDEYSTSGWDVSNWTFGKELSSEQVILGGKSATLSTYAGHTPMQSELIVHNPNVPSGNHFITTKNNFVVSIQAGFNICQQPGDGEGITNKQADFTQQPETNIAKKIIKSIQF